MDAATAYSYLIRAVAESDGEATPHGPAFDLSSTRAGGMRALIAAHDWAATPIGPTDGWPQSLRTVVELMLGMRQPACIAYGPQLTSLYNDAFIPILGAGHPDRLGKPYAEVCSEMWDDRRAIVEAAMRGEAHCLVDQAVAFDVGAERQTRWFTFGWTPLPIEDGAIAGFFCTATETTERVLVEAALRDREAELRRVQEIGGIGSLTYDLVGNWAIYSSGYLALHGLPADQPGETREQWLARVHPEDREKADCELSEALAGRTPRYESEFRVIWPGCGSIRWVMARGEVERDPVTGAASRLSVTQYDVTAQRQAEEDLRGSREVLETVVNRIPAAVSLIRGRDLRLQLVNPAYRAIAPGKMMVGKTLDDLWPETRQDFAAICRRVLETGEAHHVEDELNLIDRRGGASLEAAYFSWSLHRVRLPGDQGWGLLNTAWETTERKRAEETHQRREAELREAQRVAHLGSWFWDAETDVTTGSAELLRIFGFDPASQGMPNFRQQRGRCYPPDEWDRLSAARENTMKTGVGYQLDVRAIRNGSPIWVTSRGESIRTPAGQIVGLRGTDQDITERKQVEEQLRRSEARYRMLHEGLRDPFGEVTMEGRLVNFNELYCQMLGYTREELLGLTYQKLTPDRWHAFEEGIVKEQIVPRGYSDVYEKEYRRKDGKIIPVELRAMLYRDAEGTPATMWALVCDISERKRVEEQLRRGYETISS